LSGEGIILAQTFYPSASLASLEICFPLLLEVAWCEVPAMAVYSNSTLLLPLVQVSVPFVEFFRRLYHRTGPACVGPVVT